MCLQRGKTLSSAGGTGRESVSLVVVFEQCIDDGFPIPGDIHVLDELEVDLLVHVHVGVLEVARKINLST
jgi:hypothetical protein